MKARARPPSGAGTRSLVPSADLESDPKPEPYPRVRVRALDQRGTNDGYPSSIYLYSPILKPAF